MFVNKKSSPSATLAHAGCFGLSLSSGPNSSSFGNQEMKLSMAMISQVNSKLKNVNCN
jgi:hypothetical protein